MEDNLMSSFKKYHAMLLLSFKLKIREDNWTIVMCYSINLFVSLQQISWHVQVTLDLKKCRFFKTHCDIMPLSVTKTILWLPVRHNWSKFFQKRFCDKRSPNFNISDHHLKATKKLPVQKKKKFCVMYR